MFLDVGFDGEVAMFEYALEVHEEPGSVWVSCAETLELHATGDTLEEAQATALGASEKEDPDRLASRP